MAKRIESGYTTAYLEYALYVTWGYSKELVCCSVFDRSMQNVKSVCAGIASGGLLKLDGRRMPSMAYNFNGPAGDSYTTPVQVGKTRVCTGVVLSRENGRTICLTTRERLHKDFYSFLMNSFELPLLPEWSPVIYGRLKADRRLWDETSIEAESQREHYFPLGAERVELKELVAVKVSLNEQQLEETVSDLLRKGKIHIAAKPQKKLVFNDMDQYFSEYGSGVVENLKNQLSPVSPLVDHMDYAALKSYRLYPQQIAICSGVANYFAQKKGRYAILNCGMGTGKTIMGIVSADAYFNQMAMRRTGKTLPEILKDRNAVNYRIIVMCPPHLVSKWVAEVNNQIPHAHAVAITDFSQLLEIRAKGKARHGKEVFVLSKDFCKLDYMAMPAVSQVKHRRVWHMACNKCGAVKPMSYIGSKCQTKDCDGTYVRVTDEMTATGYVCPECGELLCIPPKKMPGEEFLTYCLEEYDFKERTTSNDRCWNCGASLWQPYVKNIGESAKKPLWHRMTHYANAAHRGKKTVWLRRGTEDAYFAEVAKQAPLNDLGGEGGCRKYAPASYIKKYLKGYFDFAIFDELHQYKSSGSAQGNAMGALIAASRYQIGLTGTIAGGYASHLFSMLFRLDPQRMKSKGFVYGGETEFAERYGVIERRFEATENVRSNAMSKGKQHGSPKEKPGISPRVFTDFLMDRCVFLDLSDMSQYLPPLKEQVVVVDSDPDVLREYNRVVKSLRDRAKEKGGNGLLSSMLQFALSYPDKPYGAHPVVHPKTGQVVVAPKSFEFYKDNLLPKEEKLVELVNSELAEGRNLVVFCEFTNSEDTCITERLQSIIEDRCNLYGQVQIISASSPAAIKREQWLHEKAAEGVRVFITNPKILETGVDLCFKVDGVEYNYPTLVFYQTGYSLFTIWQASRRHYRLIQRKECRTYYMAAGGTLQPAVIKLIAAKQVATAAIQGRFSAEGLASMAEGVDVRLELVKSLAEGDTENINELQQMFDVLAAENGEASDVPMMPTYYELVGEEVIEEPEEIPELPEIPDVLDGLPEDIPVDDDSAGENFFGFDLFGLVPGSGEPEETDMFVPDDFMPETVPAAEEKSKKKREPALKGAAGTLSFFDFI